MKLGFCSMLYNLSAEMAEAGTGESLRVTLALGGIQANERAVSKN